jgi:hypothetical protein
MGDLGLMFLISVVWEIRDSPGQSIRQSVESNDSILKLKV